MPEEIKSELSVSLGEPSPYAAKFLAQGEDQLVVSRPSEELGGAFGEVLLAQTASGRLLAIKANRGDRRVTDDGTPVLDVIGDSGELHAEYEMLVRAAESGVTPVPVGFGVLTRRTSYGMQRQYHRAAIIEEFVVGDTLDRVIERGDLCNEDGRVDPVRLCSMMEGLCEAVACLGEKSGISHRDIKPKNVVVTKSGSLRLLDFGLSRLFEGATESGLSGGSYPYSSPEHADAAGPLGGMTTAERYRFVHSAAVDVYALGVTALCARLVPEEFDNGGFLAASLAGINRQSPTFTKDYLATRPERNRLGHYLAADQMRPGDAALSYIIEKACRYIASERPSARALGQMFGRLAEWHSAGEKDEDALLDDLVFFAERGRWLMPAPASVPESAPASVSAPEADIVPEPERAQGWRNESEGERALRLMGAAGLFMQAEERYARREFGAAANLYQEAAEAGEYRACLALANCHLLGRGRGVDYRRARDYAEQVLDCGPANSWAYVAAMRLYGWGADELGPSVRSFLRMCRSVEERDLASDVPHTCTWLGDSLFDGSKRVVEELEATCNLAILPADKFDPLKVRAREGRGAGVASLTLYQSGCVFYHGALNVERDLDVAIWYFLLAAIGEVPDALVALSECFRLGKGIERDLGAGWTYLSRAIEVYENRFYAMGLPDGGGMPLTRELAPKCFEPFVLIRQADRSAKLGHLADALGNLREAADLCGSTEGHYRYGMALLDKSGLDDAGLREAVRQLEVAAWQGHADAAGELRDLCLGLGDDRIEIDVDRALFWDGMLGKAQKRGQGDK